MAVIHNTEYIPYKYPKFGLFEIGTQEYDAVKGWITEQQTLKIIGETQDNYIERLIESGEYTIVKGLPGPKHMTAIGPHKTRLIKWVSG
jgi:hypothetical protein